MIQNKIIKNILLAVTIVLVIFLVTLSVSSVLILNSNYLDEGILKDEAGKYNTISLDVVSQIEQTIDVFEKIEINVTFSNILISNHENPNDVNILYESINFEDLFLSGSELRIYQDLTIYTSNETAVFEPKISLITPTIQQQNWYVRAMQSRRKTLFYTTENNEVYAIYKFGFNEDINTYTHLGVAQIDFSFLAHAIKINHNILIANVAYSDIAVLSSNHLLAREVSEYLGISNNTYIDDEMVLVYTIRPGTTTTRWNLLIVLDRTNYIYEFITYSTVILSIFSAIIFMFYYRNSFIKKISKSFNELSYDNLEGIIYKNQSNKIDYIIQSMYAKIELLIKKNQELDKMNQQKEFQKNEAEINALLTQINPHYIFNLLNSIHKRALKNNEIESAKMILLMSKQLRRSLEWNNPLITIKEEIDHIKSYIALQQYYHGMEYHIQYDIDENLYINKVPKLILQTLIENALKHGVLTAPFQIKLHEQDNFIKFTMKNEVETDAKDVKRKINAAINQNNHEKDLEGVGLSNMARRLRYYYMDDFKITISAYKKTISISIEIPK
jgi:two-component system, sensor histidine kinase YesM